MADYGRHPVTDIFHLRSIIRIYVDLHNVAGTDLMQTGGTLKMLMKPCI